MNFLQQSVRQAPKGTEIPSQDPPVPMTANRSGKRPKPPEGVTIFIENAQDYERLLRLDVDQESSVLFANKFLAQEYDGSLNASWFAAGRTIENAGSLRDTVLFFGDPRLKLRIAYAVGILEHGVKHYFTWHPENDISERRNATLLVSTMLLQRSPSVAGLAFAHLLCRIGDRKPHLFPIKSVAPKPSAPATSKILLVSGTLGAGGAERQLVNFVTGIPSGEERSVEVLCENILGDAGFFAPRIREAGINVSQMESPSHRALEKRYGELNRKLRREAPLHVYKQNILSYYHEFQRIRPELVHLWLDYPNTFGGVAALHAGIPHILLSTRNVSPPNFALHLPTFRQTYRYLLSHPRVSMLNNSKAGAKDYANWLDINPDDIHVIHNGVDTEYFSEPNPNIKSAIEGKLALDRNAPVVGTVMRFNEEKRPHFWVKIALEVLKEIENCQFLMVGDGPMRAEVQQHIESTGHTKSFRLPGTMMETPEILHLMDCFLLASQHEGLPNVLLEAQCAGTPVVASHVGGSPETIDQGRTGWTIIGDDPVAYANQIVTLLRNDQLKAEMSNAGKSWIQNNFSTKHMIQATTDLYRHMIAEAESPVEN